MQMLLFDPGPRRARLTRWQILCRREPRLCALEASVREAARRGEPFSRAWADTTRRLRRLVGWFAENVECGSQGDYEAAYRHLLSQWIDGKPLPRLPHA